MHAQPRRPMFEASCLVDVEFDDNAEYVNALAAEIRSTGLLRSGEGWDGNAAQKRHDAKDTP